jgi:hypothetical protein
MNRTAGVVAPWRECYSTKQIRCNQFLANKLHLIGFTENTPFCSFSEQEQRSQAKAQSEADSVDQNFS